MVLFHLGGPSGGIGFHRSAESWTGVVYGVQKVLVYPPYAQITPGGNYNSYNIFKKIVHKMVATRWTPSG